MKNIFNLYSIRRKLMQRSPVWIIAAICTAIFLGIMYTFAPAYVCSTYLLSSVFMYILGVILCVNVQGKENDVFEEVVLLHCRSDLEYCLSREWLQLRMCMIFAGILALFPILKSMTSPQFFTRAITAGDVVCGGVMIVLCGVCGMETADLFHPRILNRKFGISFVILLSVLALCKQGLIETLSCFRILDWLVPPVMDSFVLLGNGDRFEPIGIAWIAVHMGIFSVILMLIKNALLLRHWGRKGACNGSEF